MRHKEDKLQIACVKWFDMQWGEYSLLLHHSPNGGYRTPAEGRIFKAMGTRAGFPDLILLLPRKGFSALAIEMKTEVGRQNPNQKAWEEVALKNCIAYVIVRNVEEFVRIVNEYLN